MGMDRTMTVVDMDPGSGSDAGIDVGAVLRLCGLPTAPRPFEPESVVGADGVTVWTWRGGAGDNPHVPAERAWPIKGGRWRGVSFRAGGGLAVLPVVR